MNIKKLKVSGVDYNIEDASARNMIASEYDSTKQYQKGDCCIYQDVLYRALDTTTGTFTASKWESGVVTDMTSDAGVELTLAEYEALGDEKLTDGIDYYIKDGGNTSDNLTASNLTYNNSTSGLGATTVQSAIDLVYTELLKMTTEMIKPGATIKMQSNYNTPFTISDANQVMTPYTEIEVVDGPYAIFSVANGVFTALCDISHLSIALIGTTSLNAEGTSTSAGHNSTHQYCVNGVYTDLGQLAGGSTANYSTVISLKDIKMGDTLSFHVSLSYAGATPYLVRESVTFDAIL